jgi:nickel-dependent lactate racemase
MFPQCPADRFLVHDWRGGVIELGRLEAPLVAALTQGAASFDWPVQVNRIIRDGGFSLIISIGQVVPHEVSGMANHAKNILVGAGGKEAINKSHFAGALYGLERIMGRRDTPVRAFFDEGLRRFAAQLPPILWVLTVVSPKAGSAGGSGPDSAPQVHGLYAGFGRECFELASALSQELNITAVDKPVRKAVVYLDPREFQSAWIGNKAVYRTRMAIADGGELLILAPGVTRFGEDPAIDALIRRHGYCSAEEVQERMRRDRELAELQSAAAHLVHGSSNGRFTIRYCPNAALSREEVEGVRYAWGDLGRGLKRYPPATLNPGWNRLADGEEFYWIPNPALGLWKA